MREENALKDLLVAAIVILALVWILRPKVDIDGDNKNYRMLLPIAFSVTGDASISQGDNGGASFTCPHCGETINR